LRNILILFTDRRTN